MHIIGDVEGRTCILVDDMVDTAGTLCHAATALKKHGAAKVYAYCTHPVLSGRAIENIENSVLDELVVVSRTRQGLTQWRAPCPTRLDLAGKM
jgi:ribose-phosphate pyrophosphokinase